MIRVARDVRTGKGRRSVLVRDVDVDECPRCGERLYDLPALRKIREARRAAGLRSAA
jgi:YgiT-type zinc finger domain-containing protein